MVLAEIPIKLIFSQKERKAVCCFWLFKYILWPQWFAYELSLQVYARRHVFLLSIYRSILILFSVNIMYEGNYCCKISTNFILGT